MDTEQYSLDARDCALDAEQLTLDAGDSALDAERLTLDAGGAALDAGLHLLFNLHLSRQVPLTFNDLLRNDLYNRIT